MRNYESYSHYRMIEANFTYTARIHKKTLEWMLDWDGSWEATERWMSVLFDEEENDLPFWSEDEG